MKNKSAKFETDFLLILHAHLPFIKHLVDAKQSRWFEEIR